MDSWDVGEDSWGDAIEDKENKVVAENFYTESDSQTCQNLTEAGSKYDGANNDLGVSGGDPGSVDLMDLKQMNIGDDLMNSEADGIVLGHCQPEDVAMETCKQSILMNMSILKRENVEASLPPISESSRESHDINSLVAYYLSAFEEAKSSDIKDRHIQQLMKDYSRREGCDFDKMLDDRER
jgi:hypothetical protein